MPRGVPAFGALSSLVREQVYWFGARGLVYTSPWVVTASTERQSAVLLLTASGRPVELHVAGRVVRHDSIAIAPLTRRGLRAVDVGLVSVNVQPHHPGFRVFCGIPRPGVLALDRRAFRRFDADLVRAYEGRLGHAESERLFEGLVASAAAQVRQPAQRDGRSDVLRGLLRENPRCSLGDLARELHLSYTSASHLFSREIGVPFRTYQHWLKCMKATEGLNGDLKLTELAQRAGFADSAHLTRAWRRRFGLPPSYLRDRRHVRIVD